MKRQEIEMERAWGRMVEAQARADNIMMRFDEIGRDLETCKIKLELLEASLKVWLRDGTERK